MEKRYYLKIKSFGTMEISAKTIADAKRYVYDHFANCGDVTIIEKEYRLVNTNEVIVDTDY